MSGSKRDGSNRKQVSKIMRNDSNLNLEVISDFRSMSARLVLFIKHGYQSVNHLSSFYRSGWDERGVRRGKGSKSRFLQKTRSSNQPGAMIGKKMILQLFKICLDNFTNIR